MLTQPYGFAYARLGLGYLRDGPPALIDDGRNRDLVPKSISIQFPGAEETRRKYFRPVPGRNIALQLSREIEQCPISLLIRNIRVR
jgi:hypothetical protein